MLKIYNLSYKNLFENISFNVKKGLIGITGPSGSGKTTFLKIVGGFINPTNGYIEYIENNNIYKIKKGKFIPKLNKNISFHFQDYLLLDLDVKTNIELPFTIGGVNKDQEWVDYLLDYFEIKHLLNKQISEISGGEKERVAIVRCFVNKPYIALIDEAGSALDQRLKEKLYSFINEYKKNNIILYISHDREFLDKFKLKNSIYNGSFQIIL